MFSPPKISWVISGIKYIYLHLLPVFYLIEPSSKQIFCFDFRKQNSVLPIVFYVPWSDVSFFSSSGHLRFRQRLDTDLHRIRSILRHLSAASVLIEVRFNSFLSSIKATVNVISHLLSSLVS
jgi:hypothetical protein